jgi:Zn-dependent M28 family amino/carboxypeptidase
MSASVWLRWGFYVFVGLLFLFALAGMYVTGPVVVRVERIDELRRSDDQLQKSEARLRKSVEKLCADFAPRDYEHRSNLGRVALWIASEFENARLKVELQDYEAGGNRYHNVIGRRPGSDPDAPAIVIGAHYDTFGDSPGADDNASGVAVMLELVQTLPTDRPPQRTHYFVAFGTEEPPFFGTDEMGSYVFGRKLLDEGTAVRLMISLDLVGYFTEGSGTQRFPSPVFRLLYPDRGDFIAVIGDAHAGKAIERAKRGLMAGGELPVHSFRGLPGSELVELSDHLSFRRLGLPAVQVTDTAFMRYPYYHQIDDTPEKLDYARMAELVYSLHGVLWEAPP